MQRALTKDSYAERIDRVLVHIAEDIDRRHSLDDLAGVACFSPYHFHRVYRAVTGETVDETVRRLRLHRAAFELNSTALPIARIATRAGYGSVAAFSRTFRADYGHPPASYRRIRNDLPGVHKPKRKDLPMYDIEIGTTPRLRLVGLDHKGDYNAIGTTFERVSAMAAAKGLFNAGTRMLGIYYDSPDAVPAAQLRSFAGLTVPEDYTPDNGMRIEVIEAGAVASLLHKGPYAELSKAYDHLFCDWLPSSGREPADRPPFEEYLNNPRELPPSEWLTKVSIPLAQQGAV
jgi:AraC family transcriptional regulator